MWLYTNSKNERGKNNWYKSLGSRKIPKQPKGDKGLDKILEQLAKRAELLKRGIKRAEKDAKAYPEGNLWVSSGGKNKGSRYYRVSGPANEIKEYIPAENRGLKRALAQKSYNKKFCKLARQELSSIEKFTRKIEKINANAAYINLSEERKGLVEPYIITDEVYAALWQSECFRTNEFKPESKVYSTMRGEKVRSKSEALIANTLFYLGIPYHYEKELILKDGRRRYPDFTILKVRQRKEVYLEHLGLLDNPDYFMNWLKRMDEYHKSGIYTGSRLFMTFETKDAPLNIEEVKSILEHIVRDEV